MSAAGPRTAYLGARLLDPASGLDAPGALLTESTGLETMTMVQLRRRDALYLRPEEAIEGAAESSRVAHNLKALLRASRTIRASNGVDELARDLADLIAETIPATELALLLFENGSGEPTWSFSWQRRKGACDGLPVPESTVAFDLILVILTGVLLLPMAFTAFRLSRLEGGLLVGCYVLYTTYLLLDSTGHDQLDSFTSAVMWVAAPGLALILVVSLVLDLRRRRRERQSEVLNS